MLKSLFQTLFFTSKKRTFTLDQHYPILFNAFCMTTMKVLFKNDLSSIESKKIVPPFKKTNLPPQINEVKASLPILMYNTLVHQDFPRNEEYLRLMADFETELREKDLPWINAIMETSEQGIEFDAYIAKLPDDDQAALTISREMFSETVEKHANELSQWYIDNWGAVEYWLYS